MKKIPHRTQKEQLSPKTNLYTFWNEEIQDH